MEKSVLLILGLGVWIALDPVLIPRLDKLQEPKSRYWWSILKEEPFRDWMRRRYEPLRKLRFLWVAVAFSPSFTFWFTVSLTLFWGVFKLPYWSLKHKAQNRIAMIRYQFPIYLRQLQVLLQNNTVVRTIELSLEYVPDLLRPDIEDLHRKLTVDPMNLNTYLKCMDQYGLPEIKRAMKWLYRYQNIGYQDAYRQFNRMIGSTSKWLRQARLESRESAMMRYQWMGLLPLLGVTLVFVSAMMSVALSLFERG